MLSTKSRGLAAWLDALPGLARAFALAAAVAVVLVGLAFAAAALSAFAPTARLAVVAGGAQGWVTPADAPTINVPRLGNTLAGVTLYRVTRDAGGKESQERVPARLVPTGEAEGLALDSNLRLVKADGSSPLAYDGEYRLSVSSNVLAPALPFPRFATVDREYTFKTLTTPRALVPGEVVRLRFGEPLRIAWDAPVAAFGVETTPATPVRAWIDPADRRLTYVEMAQAATGTRYEVQVREARGENGAPLLAPATIAVETPASPRPIADQAKLEKGTRVVLPWDNPIGKFTYEISPAVDSAPAIDPADPRRTYIELRQPKLKQKYTVNVTSAVSTLDAPMTGEPRTFSVTTPPPLGIAKLTPRGDEIGVGRDAAISIRFSEPIRDRAAAEASVSLSPAVAGTFEWPDADRLRFVPREPLPPLTKVNVRLAPGPDGASGQSGAYLDQPYEYAFTTQPDKTIDVNLSSQRITLLQAGKAVYSAPVSTGVTRAETPTGQYLVTLKWEKLRMRGTNPSGTTYDIPDVPWVMSFLGDYTIHGAPWRSQFGFPQSNGCVSMETGVAKYVYDWTPLGTPVRIHY